METTRFVVGSCGFPSLTVTGTYAKSPAYRPALILGPPDTFGRGLSFHIEVEANADTAFDTASYIQCERIRSINPTDLYIVSAPSVQTSATKSPPSSRPCSTTDGQEAQPTRIGAVMRGSVMCSFSWQKG